MRSCGVKQLATFEVIGILIKLGGHWCGHEERRAMVCARKHRARCPTTFHTPVVQRFDCWSEGHGHDVLHRERRGLAVSQ